MIHEYSWSLLSWYLLIPTDTSCFGICFWRNTWWQRWPLRNGHVTVDTSAMHRCDATTPTDGCGSSKPRTHLGSCSKTTIPFLFTSSYSMLFYVILEDIQQKHRFFSIFLPHFPRNTWAFHGFSTGFPHFLGRSLAPDLPTGQQASASGLTIDSTQVRASKFSAEMGHPWVFFGFSPGFFGILACFFSDFPWKWHGHG